MKRMLTPKKRILRDILFAGTCMFSLCGIALLIPGMKGLKMYAVTSGSMAPAIPAGSLILVDPSRRIPHIGEVMTYRLRTTGSGMTVTHRVHEIRPDGRLLMKGDANAAPDLNVISRDALIGTVVSSIPGLGFLQESEGLRIGISALAVLCAAGLAADSDRVGKGGRK